MGKATKRWSHVSNKLSLKPLFFCSLDPKHIRNAQTLDLNERRQGASCVHAMVLERRRLQSISGSDVEPAKILGSFQSRIL